MIRARLLASALVLPLAAPVVAQTTWTVGPVGSGANFNSIQLAIETALPGDVLVVWPGSYTQFTVDKPLRILGEGTGPVLVQTPTAPGVVVRDLDPGEEVVISGLDVEAQSTFVFGSLESIQVLANAGTVVLQDLRVDDFGSMLALDVTNCDRVVLLDCDLIDSDDEFRACAEVTGSTVLVVDSTIQGGQSTTGLAIDGAHGLRVTDSTLHAWRSTFRGGDGSGGKPVFVPPDGGDGLVAVNSDVFLYGGLAGELRGGDGFATILFGGVGAGGVQVLSLDAGDPGRRAARAPRDRRVLPAHPDEPRRGPACSCGTRSSSSTSSRGPSRTPARPRCSDSPRRVLHRGARAAPLWA